MKKLPCPICGELMDAEDAQIMGGCRKCLRGGDDDGSTASTSYDDE